MDGSSGASGGHRFRRIPRQSLAHLKLDPLVIFFKFYFSVKSSFSFIYMLEFLLEWHLLLVA